MLPSLMKYVEIPNLSIDFDQDYFTNGLIEKAAVHIIKFIEDLKI